MILTTPYEVLRHLRILIARRWFTYQTCGCMSERWIAQLKSTNLGN